MGGGVGGSRGVLSSLVSFTHEDTKLLYSVPLLGRLSHIGRCYVSYTKMIVKNLLQYVLFHTALQFSNNSQLIARGPYFIFLLTCTCLTAGVNLLTPSHS